MKLSERLTDSPSCVVADDAGMSMHLQRLMASAGQNMPEVKPTLELNPEHEMVKCLQKEQNDELFSDWVQLLFEQALLTESGHLSDPGSFVKRLNRYLAKTK